MTDHVSLDTRQWIIDLVRNEYDKAPDYFLARDYWDDGADRIADQIIERLCSAQSPTPPVAWRWRRRGNACWIYNPELQWVDVNKDDPDLEFEPLYAVPVSSTHRCQRCGSSGDVFILCAGCQSPVSSTDSPTDYDRGFNDGFAKAMQMRSTIKETGAMLRNAMSSTSSAGFREGCLADEHCSYPACECPVSHTEKTDK